MNLLLDTHAFIWFGEDNPSFPLDSKKLIEDYMLPVTYNAQKMANKSAHFLATKSAHFPLFSNLQNI